jgi:hypothetical protein
VGFLVGTATLGRGFSQFFGFFLSISFQWGSIIIYRLGQWYSKFKKLKNIYIIL